MKTGQEKLPNLLIIGVPKAGTTSLYNYLAGNDQIYFPDIKEPHFFINDHLRGKVPILINDWKEYSNLFSSAGESEIIGEASVFYFYYADYAVPKIKKYLGDDIYIILMIRNPVERAFSAYKYVTALNKDEDLPFSEAIKAEEKRVVDDKVSPMLHYVSCGMYADRLAYWTRNFSKLKVVVFDDFVANPLDTVEDIFGFLGVDSVSHASLTKQYNAGFGGEWRNPFMGKFVKKIVGRSVRDFSQKFFPSIYQFGKNQFLKAAMRETSMAFEDKQLLLNIFSSDVNKTAKIINRDLSSWLQ